MNDGDVTNQISFSSLLCPFFRKSRCPGSVTGRWRHSFFLSLSRSGSRTRCRWSSCSKKTSRACVTVYPPNMSHLCSRTSLWLPHCCGATCGSLYALQRLFNNRREVVFFCWLPDLWHVSFILRPVCVWMEPWDCCLTILYIKTCTHSQHRALGDDTSCSCVTLPSLFILFFLNALKRRYGDLAGGGACRLRRTSGSITNSQRCQMFYAQ